MREWSRDNIITSFRPLLINHAEKESTVIFWSRPNRPTKIYQNRDTLYLSSERYAKLERKSLLYNVDTTARLCPKSNNRAQNLPKPNYDNERSHFHQEKIIASIESLLSTVARQFLSQLQSPYSTHLLTTYDFAIYPSFKPDVERLTVRLICVQAPLTSPSPNVRQEYQSKNTC